MNRLHLSNLVTGEAMSKAIQLAYTCDAQNRVDEGAL